MRCASATLLLCNSELTTEYRLSTPLFTRTRSYGRNHPRDSGTPNSNTKNSATKICSKGWVAQKPFLIGNLMAALRLSKGWVRKDANLGLRTGCMRTCSLDYDSYCSALPE